MFEDDDCSSEEAQLIAAMLGKTYAECRTEWDLQFKKEFVLSNDNIIERYSWDGSASLKGDGKCHFRIITRYRSDFNRNKICKCSNVEIEPYEMPPTIFGISPSPPLHINMVLSFWKAELDQKFIHDVYDKIRKYCNP